MTSRFIEVFGIVLRHTIISYFIKEDQYSNESNELINIMTCCRLIYHSFRPNFIPRCQYIIDNTTDFESDRLKLAKHIGYCKKNQKFLRKLPACVVSIVFFDGFNGLLNSNDLFPVSLTSIVFGHQ